MADDEEYEEVVEVLYKQNWEDTKDKYLLPPDAPELVQAIKNTAMFSKIAYKKGHTEQQTQFTSLPDPPDIEFAKKVTNQVSKFSSMFNVLQRKYQEDFEKMKDQIYFMQTETPEYKVNKQAGVATSKYTYKVHPDKTKFTQVTDSPVLVQAQVNSKQLSDLNYKAKHENEKFKCHIPPDTPALIQHKVNAYNLSDNAYKYDWEKTKAKKFDIKVDAIPLLAAKANTRITSDVMYKKDYEKSKGKMIGALSINDDPKMLHSLKTAKNQSDREYRKDYEKSKTIYTTPLDMLQVTQAKKSQAIASDVDYRHLLHSYSYPPDSINVDLAKKAYALQSDIAYKVKGEEFIHKYSLPADVPQFIQAKVNAYNISENMYKADLKDLSKKGYDLRNDAIPIKAAKAARQAASDVHYKKDYEKAKGKMVGFRSLQDDPKLVHYVNVAKIQSDREYKKDYEKTKTKYNTPHDMFNVVAAKKAQDVASNANYKHLLHHYTYLPDAMDLELSKNMMHIQSDNVYKEDYNTWMKGIGWIPIGSLEVEKVKKAGDALNEKKYRQHPDTLKFTSIVDSPVMVQAKQNTQQVSDYKYKEAYEKAKGKHMGFRSLQDDPKLVHYMNMAKLQSDREYKKNYENTKTSYHTPGDMVSITAAKMAQDVATNINYKQPIHHYTYLPDALSLEHTRNMNQIQSDNVYKDEYNNFFKGVGWIPFGSLEVEKAKKAGDALNERKYRQHPDTIKFTSVPDSVGMVLAQHNTKQLSDFNYKVEGEKRKHKYTMDPDVPQFIQAKVNAFNISDFKYKEGYEKAKGKQIGFLSLQDDPKLVHYMNVAKIQSDREYKKGYEASKTKYHTPLDMFSVTAAKKSQEVATNTNYRQPFHHYTLLPDALNVEHSRNAMQIQSDNLYKSDFTNWMKGIGWVPIESLEVEKAKKAGEILSEKKYRQHPETLKFTYAMDTLEQALNRSNKQIMNKPQNHCSAQTIEPGSATLTFISVFIFLMVVVMAVARLYSEKWNKDKTTIHIMPDTPDILLSRVNQITMSDYKYRQAYEQAKGKHIGFRSLEDDPKLVHFMQVAKMQSDREYKKAYEKSKTSFHTPVDMLSMVAAKKSQEVATNTNYRNVIHAYNMLPDAMSFELAKNMMQIQSDNQYKADYADYMKGIGWLPLGSLEAEKNKKAMELISEKKYRQHPDTLKYSTLMDSVNMVLAKNNAKIMNEKLYKLSLEESKKKGYDLRTDAIPIKAAKASRDIASDYKYKHNYEKERGKMVGFRSLEDDPKLVHSMQVAKMQSDREYKKNYEKTKTSYHTPADMLSVTAAKDAQANITNTNYKHLIHSYFLPPDSMNIQLSKNMNHIQSDNVYKHDYNEWFKGLGWSPAGSLEVEKAKKATENASDQKYRQHPSNFQFKKLNDSMDMVLAKQNTHTMNKFKYKQGYRKQVGHHIGFRSLQDDPKLVLSMNVAKMQSEREYKKDFEKWKTKFSSPVDMLGVVLAKKCQTLVSDIDYKNYLHQWTCLPDQSDVVQAKKAYELQSEKHYRMGYEELKKKGYDLPVDAISLKAAKASREIASEYKYKDGFRKQLGHHIGARAIHDDPKMMWSMHVAKIQSDREYKKDFEKWKTKFSSPVDMLGVVLAKKCQTLVSDIDYKNYLHQWTCLPDETDIMHARWAYDLQSDNMYKSDLQWLRGIGWVPIGSLDVEKCKRATEILSDKIYRQPPDQFRFTSVTDSPEQVLAKNNAITMNKRLYTEAWDKDKTQVHITADTPEITQARINKINYSESRYKLANEEAKKKGYDLRSDAIPIVAAKASRDIISDYKYKDGYRKQLGHHVGARDVKDDPKMMWSMHVAKIQSDREYKKDFEKWKTKFSSPVDMLGMVQAKKCQTLVSDMDYKNYLHQWTCLPDQTDVMHARQAYDLQSDNVYKSDLQWLRGIGWVPIGSVDVVRCKRAAEILSDNIYRQCPDKLKFTSVADSLEQVLAKNNAINMNKHLYTEAWDKDKTQIHIMPDTPEIMLARQNKLNYSETLYKLANEEAKKKGYDLRSDAIPIVAAKASRDIVSDYIYKDGYRKQLGHHVGARDVKDDPKMMWSMHVAKIQSDREYKKDFEKWKTKFSSPVDMLGMVQAKKCQTLVSDMDYKNYLHQWTCLPDQNDVMHARQAYDLQSDNIYKSDLQWLRGIGWVPIGSVDVVRCKRAAEILSDNTYRQCPDKLKFTSVTDSLEQVLAKNNAITMSKRLYTEAWDNDKTQIHMMPDTPEIMLARQNKINYSENLYRQAMEEAKKEGYDLRSDAIPIVAAKASRDIASDYKYKETYRKQLGHHIGARMIHDDPKMMWSLHVAKMQSDREYKKDFEKYKTRFSSPVDTLGIVLAKKCQTLVSDVDYKHPLHEWTCLPDQSDVIHARKAYDLQSDKLYKLALEESKKEGYDLRVDAIPIQAAKASRNIASDYKYKEDYRKQLGHHIGARNVKDDTKMMWSIHMAKIQSDRQYKKDFENWKTKFSSPVDMLGVVLAKKCQILVSNIDYKKPLHEWTCLPDQNDIIQARKAYDLQSDAIYKADREWLRGIGWVPIGSVEVENVKRAGEILSDRKYRQPADQLKFTSITDTPEIVLAKNNALTMSKKLYTKGWDESKMKDYDLRADAILIKSAKASRDIASDNVYKADLEWLRGIGWMPEGSVEMTRVKGAQHLLNERLYRTRPEALKFTSIVDTPAVVLAKANSLQMSEKLYQKDWDEAKQKGYDLRADAVEIKHAKASREIASEYKYKEGYRKQLGHYVGFRSLQDDPKLVWSIHAAKIQSDREYKKAYEKSKEIHTTPLDMMSIVQAKKCQVLVSDIDYRNYLHQWMCLPDQNDMIQAKKAYELQSDNVYKSDLEWLKGIGWLPEGSVEVMRVKNAQNLLNERLYRTRPEALKFTSIVDTPEVILAKINAVQISEPLYRDAWDKEKANVNVPADTPLMLQSKINTKQISNKQYQQAWEDFKMTGYDLRADAIGIRHAKASRDIASDYLYKTAYEKQKGHYVGCRNAKEDPKLVWAAHVLKMQNDRLYKKAYNDHKAKITIPTDMVSINAAKEGQALASDVDYRHYLHQWSCFPDQNDVIQARKAYDLQSDAIYKADLEWLRGIGWVPIGSPEKIYREGWDAMKMSCDVRLDAIPIQAAKASREIASDYKYKLDHEKQKGHYVGTLTARDDNKIHWALIAGKIQNEREYRLHWAKWKSKFQSPPDMLSITHSKHCQALVSDIDYRNYLHQWMCVPDQRDVIQARKAYDLQSDAIYKADLEWLRGIGWMPNDSVSVNHAKHAADIFSEKKYRTKIETLNFTPVDDRVDYVTAKQSGEILNDIKYRKDWNDTKSKYTLTETPQLHAAQEAARILDQYLYKESWEKQKATSYILPPDAVPFVHAHHSRDVQSENVYKADLEWLRGIGWIPLDSVDHVRVTKNQEMVTQIKYKKDALANYPNFTSVVDPPEIVLAKINSVNQSDILYKGAWEGTKAYGYTLDERYIPIVGAKHADFVNSELKYKETYEKLKGHYLAGKEISEFPNVVHSLDFQKMRSVNVYKSDLNWLKGIGCYVWDTPQILHAKKSYDLQSQNLYKEAWDKVKATSYTLPSNTVSLTHVKNQKHLASHTKYREEYEKFKALYTLPKSVEDDLNTARCLRVGKLNIDVSDPKGWLQKSSNGAMNDKSEHVLFNNAYGIDHARRLYRSVYEKNKMKIHMVPDMVEMVTAKESQKKVSEIDYRLHLHEWTCHPNLQVNSHVRKVTDEISNIVYKDDLNWLKGTGCYVWDTPEILHAKHAYDLRDDIKYKAHAQKTRNNYKLVTDTPIYVQAVQSGKQLSDAVYHHDYVHSVRGKVAPTTKTVDLDRALHAHKLQSEFKYKEVYEHMKANGYTLGPNDVPFVNVRRVNNVTSERLYRQLYHKLKGKIHTTPDTPEIRQVRKTQEAVSELIYKSDFFKMQGHMISLPYTPHVLHCRYVGDITSDIKYKEDLQILRGLGCFLYDTPDMVRSRHLRKLWLRYKETFQKTKGKYHTVKDALDIVYHRTVTDHISKIKYTENYMSQLGIWRSIPDRPEHFHHRAVTDAVSDVKYKEDLTWLKGIGCYAFDTPDFTLAEKNKTLYSKILYKLEYNKARPRGYTTIHDTPMLLHVQKVKDEVSDLKYKEVYQRTKSNCTIEPDAVHIKAAKDAYKVNTNLDYKKQYEANKAHWRWIPDRPDFIQAAKSSLQQSDFEYKLDREFLKGCKLSVTDDKDMVLALKNSIIESDLKYKQKHVKERGTCHAVPDTPQILLAKAVSNLVSENKYKRHVKKHLAQGSYTTLPETRDTIHVKEVTRNVSDTNYKEKFVKEKGKSNYSIMLEPPEVKHAMEVAKKQSNVAYKKDAKENLHYTTVADRPDIKKATQAAKQASEVEYRAKHRKEGSHGLSMLGRPDIEMAKKAAKLSSQYQYKKNYEKSKGRYHTIPDNLEQKKYKEDAEKCMSCYETVLDTPEMQRIRENQKNFSLVKYKEAVGQGTPIPDLPEVKRVKETQKHISSILYKENLSKGTPLPVTPEMERVKHNQENFSSVLYSDSFRKQIQGKAAYVLDTPEMRRVRETQRHISTVKYHEDFEKHKGCFTPVVTDPITERVKKNTQDFSDINYRAQAQRRSREQSRSASALSVTGGEEKSEHSEGAHLSTYSDGGVFFSATSPGTSGWP
ncbi:hypothetical protein J1605_008379 [Eschrichtius robustus]|uniref:Nebulin n=1 Tax=Eschrichtius robustus TaxID=9764 RepID=A0AB34GYD4_ESCRO|nr:hypothetical protein J1605_008379 [Eschrichtius robustus]